MYDNDKLLRHHEDVLTDPIILQYSVKDEILIRRCCQINSTYVK